MEAVDLRDLRLLLLVAAVVREVVMPVAHADEGVLTVAPVVRQHEGFLKPLRVNSKPVVTYSYQELGIGDLELGLCRQSGIWN